MRRRLRSFDPLSDLPAFAACNRRERMRLASHVELIERPAGTTVVREGARPRAVYAVRSGYLTLSSGGRLLGELGPGDLFGEVAALTGEPTAVTAVAGTDVELVEIGVRHFVAAVETMPAIARRIVRDLASGVRPLPLAA